MVKVGEYLSINREERWGNNPVKYCSMCKMLGLSLLKKKNLTDKFRRKVT